MVLKKTNNKTCTNKQTKKKASKRDKAPLKWKQEKLKVTWDRDTDSDSSQVTGRTHADQLLVVAELILFHGSLGKGGVA